MDAAIAVHRALGPGLLESVYEQCVAHELAVRGVEVRRQVALPVAYRDLHLETGFRLDLLVGGAVIAEVKAVDSLLPIHTAQILTYLKLAPSLARPPDQLQRDSSHERGPALRPLLTFLALFAILAPLALTSLATRASGSGSGPATPTPLHPAAHPATVPSPTRGAATT